MLPFDVAMLGMGSDDLENAPRSSLEGEDGGNPLSFAVPVGDNRNEGQRQATISRRFSAGNRTGPLISLSRMVRPRRWAGMVTLLDFSGKVLVRRQL
jgi:hypothetical protein